MFIIELIIAGIVGTGLGFGLDYVCNKVDEKYREEDEDEE